MWTQIFLKTEQNSSVFVWKLITVDGAKDKRWRNGEHRYIKNYDKFETDQISHNAHWFAVVRTPTCWNIFKTTTHMHERNRMLKRYRFYWDARRLSDQFPVGLINKYWLCFILRHANHTSIDLVEKKCFFSIDLSKNLFSPIIRLDFRRFLESGLYSSPRSAGSFPKTAAGYRASRIILTGVKNRPVFFIYLADMWWLHVRRDLSPQSQMLRYFWVLFSCPLGPLDSCRLLNQTKYLA